MRRHMAAGLLALLLLVGGLAGCAQPLDDGGDEANGPSADPELVAFYQQLARDRHVVFETDHGEIRLHMYESLMPVTTARFIELVESGFYDDTSIHRNVERFVIQGGDPTGTGLGGSFENIPHERHDDLLFGHGALGLARNLDEDSGDSQWFITLTPQPHLSDGESDTAAIFGTYALYGQVVEGMDTVRKLNNVPTLPVLDRPVEEPIVERATLHEPPGRQDLLGLPRTISDRVTIGDHTLDVDRPLHLFTGHPFTVGVYLRPGTLDNTPPQQVQVRYETTLETDDEPTRIEETYNLSPVDDDPWSFTGTAVLQHAGAWQEQVVIGGETGVTGELNVHGWHAGYQPFAG